MHNAPQRFGGVETQRLWVDIETIEHFLSTKWPVTVIELGTGTGAFSVYLAIYCQFHDFAFHTFDTHQIRDMPFQSRKEKCVETILCLGGNYYCSDVFSSESRDIVWDLVKSSGGPAFIYCDNGDKPREVETYKSVLRPGDFLGVHDYGYEIHKDDLPHVSFTPWNPALFEDLGSSNRILECIA
jgi:hypothetical protein